MYSGLLPKGLTDAEMSSDDEDDQIVLSYSCIQPFIENEPCLDSLPGFPMRIGKYVKLQQKKKDEINTMKLPQKRQQRRGRCKKGQLHLCFNTYLEYREPQAEHERHWDGLTQYFGINDRFNPLPVASLLEKSMESAIAEGDFGKAEEMSDRLATRELAVKIAQVTDCRDFVQSKQEVEASRAAQKRKKQIAWGFEDQQRWETKSNMGYM
uniref:Family with sequence similarity 204 member A n=1 Tax=Hucho hucho TaxID=62062 RepID=A0A4W5NRW4_9TELE